MPVDVDSDGRAPGHVDTDYCASVCAPCLRKLAEKFDQLGVAGAAEACRESAKVIEASGKIAAESPKS